MKLINQEQVAKNMGSRLIKNQIFKGLFLIATSIALIVLGILLYRIFTQGFSYLTADFFQNFASRRPGSSGIKAALIGSLWIMGVTIPISLILAVGTAIYLEEYAKKGKLTTFIQTNIANLAGVPSIVFGLLGLTVFVRFFDLGRSILAGGLTMALLILPVIVVASQEAIRSVPKDMREASYGMGATKWQTILRVVLPAAIPGILTGSILAFSRAIGETAPLLVVGAFAFVNYLPENVMSTFTIMPIQIYNWASRPQLEFQYVAAAGIIVLFIFLIVMNATAVFIRNKFQKRY
ncbi:phosphate ABC transporter permease PstA [Metabacillus fastidiosus]|uniref:Phosphate transport system permease protein PstA n=1 Tax=Metabacillus fastidiosus TaxID=1458 RepID=A0ABU6NUW8_9BACI|nr:phosphate ABC transporter permease PstA [Metabacillus fastidiosus]MEC2076557.1 phosphate ABC transporter permease PstA [Metabacillus fastidiosus]MED4400939.1 phosphate ABC transporter permease PstA [Metabacillus fastidiosus]MED4463865.1 phosphate ABC transporter permease PstA [Metabacillus fastidiosus]MED4530721.1 phosphate ABC transporter permease PstA [Metabacillus fastidiosus]